MSTAKERWPALYAGLNQLPDESVERALTEMRERPERMFYGGNIVAPRGERRY